MRSVVCGDSHALAIHGNDMVLSWGSGAAGRLGHGAGRTGVENGRGDRTVPTVIDALRSKKVFQVSAGHSHSAALVRGGKMFVWGGTSNGKLGLGPVESDYEAFCPVPYQLRFPDDVRVCAAACLASNFANAATFGIIRRR